MQVDRAKSEEGRLWSRVELVQDLCFLYEGDNRVILADSLCRQLGEGEGEGEGEGKSLVAE